MSGANMFDVSGKVSLVTGAGTGLGKAICEALAENGSDVICAYHSSEAGARETAEMVARNGVRSLVIKADVSSQEEVKAMFKKVDQEFGRLDILFNNAGVTAVPTRFHEMPREYWDKVIGVDLNGVFFCMQEGIKLMLRQKKGSIINLSSVGGIRATPGRCHYSAAKAGVIALTRSAAADYGPDGIRVNVIAPGFFTGTNLGYSAGYTEEELQKRIGKLVSESPLRRVAEPAEMKGLALYLASDASSFVTGATFVIDGGHIL